MRNLVELGFRKYGHRPFAPFSDSMLHDFESKFGVKLPTEYVTLLRLFNGGQLLVCQYNDPTTRRMGGFDEFYGLGNYRSEITAESREWEYGNLWEETPIFRLHLLRGRGVPFARDGGGNELFFDFDSVDENPPVGRFIAATRKWYRLANSFSEFVDMLHEDTAGIAERVAKKPHEWRVN